MGTSHILGLGAWGKLSPGGPSPKIRQAKSLPRGWRWTWQDVRCMGKFRSNDPLALPADLWIQPGALAKGPEDSFYGKLSEVLAGMDFAGQIHRICAPHYKD